MLPHWNDGKGFTLRARRLKLTWLLALPFLAVSRPTPRLLLAAAVLSALGLVLRAAAAGHILKDRVLATRGPYAFLRHPLYLGSFLVGTGLALAAGRWWLTPLFMVLFLWLYRDTVMAEEDGLRIRFGQPYERYREEVPAILPRVPTRGAERGPTVTEMEGFRFSLYLRNREWEAALGTGVAYGLLWWRMYLNG
jgi:hypothetical protein